MVAHCGETRGDEVAAAINMPNGSSSSSSVSGGSGVGVAKQQTSSVLKKGPWTAAEDAILMEYVKKNGEGNWNAVQKNTSLSRCGKSCRLRWTNHLRPNLRKGSFTAEEERLILQLHAQLGNKWARMAAQLPGRTDNEIKNYWNTRIKRRIRQGLPLYMNEFGSQKPTSSSPSMQLQDAGTTSAVPIRGRLPLQIPTRSISQFLGQAQMTSSPTPSPITLSPQSYSHLKSNFNHSLSLFDATSPSTSALTSPRGLPSPHSHGLPSPHSHGLPSPHSHGLPSPQSHGLPSPHSHGLPSPHSHDLPSPHSHGLSSPHSPVVLPTNIGLNSYQDHNAYFPGFSFPPTSHLQLPTSSSFRFSPSTFNLNSPQGLQPTQLPSPVYTKPAELPSNQLYQTQVEKTEYEPQPQYLHQPEPSSRQELDYRPNTGISDNSNISMLENLLHQAETMTQNQNPQDQYNFYQSQDQKFEFSTKSGYAWDDIAIGSDNSSADAGSVIKNELKEENVSLSEDLSVLLQSIPSPATLLGDYDNLGVNHLNNQSMDFGSGMAVTEDGMGLDMQQLASMFQVDSSSNDINRQTASCPWNNLPRIC